MHHRGEGECQFQFPERERLTVFHGQGAAVYAVISFYHIEGFGIADEYHVGVDRAKNADSGRVIRFHVVDYQIIESASAQNVLDVFDQAVGVCDVYRVDQCRFFVVDQVGVVRYAVRQRP